jgi:hypothetical protein
MLDFMVGVIPAASGGNDRALMEIHADEISNNLAMHETFVEITRT